MTCVGVGRGCRRVVIVASLALAACALATKPARAGVAAHVSSARAAAVALPAATGAGSQDIAGLRTRTSQTFPAAGGSYVVRISAQSLNYRDASGRWRPIDNSLHRQGAVLHNGANRYALSVPQRLGGAAAVRIASGAAWIELTPRAGRADARAAGARATFPGAWPGVQLRYTATGDAVKEALVLRDRASLRDFAFGVRVPAGDTLLPDASGGLRLLDGQGRTLLRVAPATMIDASGVSRWTRTDLQRTGPDAWTLTIVPDRAWLRSARRAWPVTIDPTVDLGPDLACSIVYDDEAGSSSSCGDALPVGEACLNGVCKLHRVLAHFDVAGAVPAGAYVEFASLDTGTSAGDVQWADLTQPWDANADWETSDGTDPWPSPWWNPDSQDPQDRGAIGATPDRVTWNDFTGLVREWLDPDHPLPNNGLLFTAARDTYDTTDIAPAISVQYAPTDEASGPVQSAAAGAYATAFGLTQSEALRRLRIQDRLSNLSDDLDDAIAAGDYGGVWIDDSDSGRIKVGIKSTSSPPPSAKTSDALQVLRDHDLQGSADFVSVDANVGQLSDAEDQLSSQLSSLLDAAKISLALDYQGNAVLISKANSLTPDEEASLDSAADAASVRVEIVPVDQPSLESLATSCATDNVFPSPLTHGLVCDFPLRGGITLSAPHTLCTAGFMAHDFDNDQYVMTAGHCVVDDQDWSAFDSNGTSHPIGTFALGYNKPIDAGTVSVDPSSFWDTSSNPHTVYVTTSDPAVGPSTTHNEAYAIHDVRRATQNTWVCTTSARQFSGGGHTSCGMVESGRVIVPFHDGKKKVIVISGCQTVPGSSGGPIYKDHHAYGLMTGKNDLQCYSEFTDARDAEAELGVTINTGS